jgi:hypothetical protein
MWWSSEDSEGMHVPRSFLQHTLQPGRRSSRLSMTNSLPRRSEERAPAQQAAESLHQCRANEPSGNAAAVLALLKNSENLKSCPGSDTDGSESDTKPFSNGGFSDSADKTAGARASFKGPGISLASCFSSSLYSPAPLLAANASAGPERAVDARVGFRNLLDAGLVDRAPSTAQSSLNSNLLACGREMSEDAVSDVSAAAPTSVRGSKAMVRIFCNCLSVEGWWHVMEQVVFSTGA